MSLLPLQDVSSHCVRNDKIKPDAMTSWFRLH